MIITANNPIQATWIFSIILVVALLLWAQRRRDDGLSSSASAELKGVAILMIVVSHIGYFLASDHRFLWPLSAMAGVGVNIFLFLSGFGLTSSQVAKPLSPWQFYRRRLGKLFQPFWLMLLLFLFLDAWLLHLTYSWDFILKALVGIFTRADIYQDLNSPLWYFSFILSYYLLFPWLFLRERPWLSAIALYLIAYAVILWEPSALDNVFHLYRVHIIAFPLGILSAWAWPKLSLIFARQPVFYGKIARFYFWPAVLALIFLAANYFSGIGLSVAREQGASLIATLSLAAIFSLKRWSSSVLLWLGRYSYEIYLFHWPLMYRHDIFYHWLPAWLATIMYFVFFLLAFSSVRGLMSRWQKKTPHPPVS